MKKFPGLFSLISMVIFLSPVSVLAHTGVGGTTGFGFGFSHPFGGMDHLLAMVAVGLWAAQMGGRAVWVVPGAFVALMILGGILGISGVQVPYVEEGILASVLVLGVLIATAFALPPAAGASIVGIFALCHGHAHGTEMLLTTGAVSYSLGFALGTALLHGLGITGGIILKKINSAKAIRFVGGAIALGGLYLVVV